MKVLIITHSLRYNYGGILQNFALQQVLKKLGHSCVTLKLRRKTSRLDSLLEFLKYLLRRLLKGRANRPLSDDDLNIICSQTDSFINRNIQMSPAMGLIDKRWISRQYFNAIVVGSDQVLHPASYKKIEDIYLSFIKGVKKVIYAGSFGPEKWNYTKRQTEKCAELVRDFSGISVREKSGKAFFQQYFNAEAELVLDPTLLLDQSEYLSLIDKPIKKSGLVTYLLDPSSAKNDIVQFVGSSLQLNIQRAGNEGMDNPSLTPSERVADRVEDWLSRMAGADFIITDSFHGTCFAIIFRKSFIAVGNEHRGLDRFRTLLSHFGLEDRLVFGMNEVNISNLISTPIQYDIISNIQEQKIKKSVDFLFNSL